jgi:hypothetical protein
MQAEETRPSLDRAREEMEIMKGILRAKLSFAADGTERRRAVTRNADIDAFYLQGQGAVFLVPVSRLNTVSDFALALPDIELDLSGQNEAIREFSEQIREYSEQVARQATEFALEASAGGRAAGNGSAAVALPEAREPRKVDREALRKRAEEARARTAEARERAAERRQRAEENHKKLLADLDGIRDGLVEALAGYGDSLTTVKPGEYVNIVLLDVPADGAGARRGSEVISAQKSWISDYKAGKLSLGEFKGKVLRYRQ